METIEIKKDSKKIEISKDTIIIILSIGIIIVSSIAICLAVRGTHENNRGRYGRARMMGQYQQFRGYTFDNNVNSYDQEIQDNQNTQPVPNTNSIVKPINTTPSTSTSVPATNIIKK